jgi:2-amino-4-hydroxy-6-hydroxymethyldihydropteridine diphosphokinase
MKENGLNLAYLSLGSNIEPEKNLKAAVKLLSRFGRVLGVSTVWETEPIGKTDQSPYLNAALLLETTLSAEVLRFEAIAHTEAELGRIRMEDKFAPRTIDIDIMLFNRDILDIGHRHVPDPEIVERPFVAVTLAELDPGYVHPENGRTLEQIAAQFDREHAGMRQRGDVQLSATA